LPSPGAWGVQPDRRRVAIFVIFIVAYSSTRQKPHLTDAIVLHRRSSIIACLLSSIATMELAVFVNLKRGKSSAFTAWWLLTSPSGGSS